MLTRQLEGSFHDAVVEGCGGRAAVAAGWAFELNGGWIEVTNIGAATPEQGWKLHVSASLQSAPAILQRVLQVLVTEAVGFKVVASLRDLYKLNLGHGGRSQIGKFITVYPADDAQAVRLAVALEEATEDLVGPMVPSDRQLRPGSVVHYRYGAFVGRYLQTPLGEVLPAIETPDGTMQADMRGVTYVAPPWVTDPFRANGVAVRRGPIDLMAGGRYLMTALLENSFRATVRLAVDTVTGETRVLKQARYNAGVDWYGKPGDRLRHEAEVLRLFAGDTHVPAVYDLFEDRDSLFLVMDHCDGLTVEQRVADLAAQGRFLTRTQVVTWARQLSNVLDRMHEKGFVYGDLKPPNLVVSPNEELRLVDFETACRLNSRPGLMAGTPGFVSPERAAGGPPRVTDDIYAFGAVVYFMATGVDPSHAPDPTRLMDRPPNLVNPAIGPILAQIIAGCLDPDRAVRPPSMSALDQWLATVEESRPVSEETALRDTREDERAPDAASDLDVLDVARRIAITLCRMATPVKGSPGLSWAGEQDARYEPPRRDINGGVAGIVLTLAEVAEELEEPEVHEVLKGGAHWLAVSSWLPGGPLPGLYVGEAGIGAALLRAGRVLGRDDFVTASIEKGRLVASLPHTSPDLFNGTAGRLRFHLALWDSTGDEEHLKAAIAAGERLLQTAEEAMPGELHWRIPDGYGPASGESFLGYAHGAAGIADALLDLFEASGQGRFAEGAQAAGRWLLVEAMPALDNGDGRDWPVVVGGNRFGGVWCHGAAGVGRFFLHAAKLGIVPQAGDMARQAARTAAQGARWAGPTQCHGLAGNTEFLLDMFQATGERALLDDAQALLRLLWSYALQGDGVSPCAAKPDRYPTDYMTGFAGVASCLLRMSAPQRLPHLLERRSLGRDRRVAFTTEGQSSTPGNHGVLILTGPLACGGPESRAAVLRHAFNALAEPEVRDRVAYGDFSALRNIGLRERERQLLRAAADNMPESIRGSCAAFWDNAAPIEIDSKAADAQIDTWSPSLALQRHNTFRNRGMRAALGRFGEALRSAGYDDTPNAGPLARLALGYPVSQREVGKALPDSVLRPLAGAGLTTRSGRDVQLRFSILSAGGALAVVPLKGKYSHLVYLGTDSLLLVEAALRLAPAGARATDLATGTGLLAAVLTNRYQVVLATDILTDVTCTAALSLALNQFPVDHHAAVCMADVAAGLRRSTFDLVTANPPWVPSYAAQQRVLADGGPTGFELPQRFLKAGADLLRPGGVAITLTTDATLDDGSRPLHEACAGLEGHGYSTEIVRIPTGQIFSENMATGKVSAMELAAVVVSRPPGDSASEDFALRAAIASLRRRWSRPDVTAPLISVPGWSSSRPALAPPH